MNDDLPFFCHYSDLFYFFLFFTSGLCEKWSELEHFWRRILTSRMHCHLLSKKHHSLASTLASVT